VHDEVMRRVRCHLGKMRYHQHLVVLGKTGQACADSQARRPADACIHFVEDEHRHVVRPAQSRLQREHDPGYLAARRYLGKRPRCLALGGSEEELHAFRSVRAPRVEIELLEAHLEPCARHVQAFDG
jgi:hypothetical protein